MNNDARPVKEKVRQPYMDTSWFAGLMDEVARTSKTAVAKKLNVDRTTISCVCNGSGEYGNGRASTKAIETAYRQHFEQLVCPHTQTQVGVTHCIEVALRVAPTHNPMQMQQWQACQQCQHKPKPMPVKEPVAKQSRRLSDSTQSHRPQETKAMQQAGIVDKRTLPLPEVGGPQISEGETE